MKKTMISFLLILVFCVAAQASLVSYWKFDEGTGANLADSSSSGFTAVTTGAVTWSGGVAGAALKFDGSSGMIKFPAAMSLSGAAWSTSLWFNTTMTGNGVLVQQRNGGFNGQFQVIIKAGKINAWTYRDGYGFNFTAPQTLNDGKWHHLVVTAESGTGKIYVDGALAASATAAAKTLNSAITIGMGADIRDNVSFLNGMIDEFMLFSHALTAQEARKAAWPGNAALVSPADGETPVSNSPTLQWDTPMLVTPTGYNVAVGTDPNILTPVFTAANIKTLSVNPGTLAFSTLYYWRVDVLNGPTVIPGKAWKFTTVSADPYVKVQPVPVTVAAGTTAQLTTLIYNAVDWKWYRQDAPQTVVGTGATLAIGNMDMSREGYYYCVGKNGAGVEVTTNTVRVMVARQIAKWGFESNLNDTVSAWNGAYTDPNLVDQIIPVPVYAAGIAGQAIKLAADGSYVDIPGSESFFNFYDAGMTFSVWINPDVPHVNTGGWYGIALKTGTGGWSLSDKQITYSGGLAFSLPNGLSLETTGRTDTGKWQLYTYTYDAVAGIVKLYRDGVFASQKEGRFLGGSTGVMRIGAASSDVGNNFRGLLDEAQIWNYPLDKYAVAALYAGPKGVSMCVDSVEGLTYDLNKDCKIDMLDFIKLSQVWMDCNLVPTCYP